MIFKPVIDSFREIIGFNEPDCNCGCKGEESHPCPYKSEINGDNEECNCCDQCTFNCSQEI